MHHAGTSVRRKDSDSVGGVLHGMSSVLTWCTEWVPCAHAAVSALFGGDGKCVVAANRLGALPYDDRRIGAIVFV